MTGPSRTQIASDVGIIFLMPLSNIQRIAVIGAGIAGSACARALTLAGHAVHVFDKSHGPGGRLATRRVEWTNRLGQACTTPMDHGAVGITARSASFQIFLDQALHAGWLAEWRPALAAASRLPVDGLQLYVPTPDMPSLCRHLLEGTPTTWSFAVDCLRKGLTGWQVEASGECHDATFDAVVLALPPAQAAPLLSPHRHDWAQHAALAPMQPCWTLLGVTDDAEHGPLPGLDWSLARPPTGPLAWVLRNDSRPGRTRVPGQAHWVLHAHGAWSRLHLEQPAQWVQQQMQAALAECLGLPIDWHYCAVHRWRYALPQAKNIPATASFWWDSDHGLGVCGDFVGGSGVEGAWLSAQSLCAALLQQSCNSAAGTAVDGDHTTEQPLVK
jgi:renalase